MASLLHYFTLVSKPLAVHAGALWELWEQQDPVEDFLQAGYWCSLSCRYSACSKAHGTRTRVRLRLEPELGSAVGPGVGLRAGAGLGSRRGKHNAVSQPPMSRRLSSACRRRPASSPAEQAAGSDQGRRLDTSWRSAGPDWQTQHCPLLRESWSHPSAVTNHMH